MYIGDPMKIHAAFFICLCLCACGGGGSDTSTPNQAEIPEPTIGTDPEPLLTLETANSDQITDASRLLNQATFGATLPEIESVLAHSAEAWIDMQFDIAPSSHVAEVGKINLPESEGNIWRNHRMYAWWNIAVHGDDQLRQRVAFALSQIMVISDKSTFGNQHIAIANYYDVLVEHSFGNFRDLLEDVTLSPLMGMYLSTLGNEKPDEQRNIRPDENFAREVMQLFTIGLEELNTDGTPRLGAANEAVSTYNQDIIENYAHVFTGWHFSGTTAETWYYWWDNYDDISPMTSVDSFHASNEKTLLSDIILPANQSAVDDLQGALDSLFYHPNVGPFIGKQLIQRLVTSNPSTDYIERVALAFNDNGNGVRGDMKAVIKAILLDPEARAVPASDDEFGKIREPLIRIAHMLRVLNISAESGLIDLPYPDYFTNQAPLSAASVFNFYSPNYTTPGELSENNWVAPELEILTETYTVRMTNYFAYTALWSYSVSDPEEDQMVIDYGAEIALLLDDPDLLIEYMDRVFLAGMMSENMKAILLGMLDEMTYQIPAEKVANLMFLVLASPQFAVQK